MAARMVSRVFPQIRAINPAIANESSLNFFQRHCQRSLCSENVSQKTEKSESSDGNQSEASSVKENELTQKNKELTEKLENTEDKYKRALAESENIRQRMRRQIDEAKLYGIQGFCKDLLDVADVLGKATESVPKDELNSKNPHLQNLFEGLQMTETQLQKVFKNHGLDKIDPLGEKFDPNFHEALFEQAIEGKQPGTVAVVTKIGYRLHERTIRPALVGVVKK